LERVVSRGQGCRGHRIEGETRREGRAIRKAEQSRAEQEPPQHEASRRNRFNHLARSRPHRGVAAEKPADLEKRSVELAVVKVADLGRRAVEPAVAEAADPGK
jgi:hypothetical protein